MYTAQLYEIYIEIYVKRWLDSQIQVTSNLQKCLHASPINFKRIFLKKVQLTLPVRQKAHDSWFEPLVLLHVVPVL